MGLRSLPIFAHAWLTGSPREATVPVEGIELPVILRVGTTDVGTFKQVFVNREYDYAFEDEPKIMIDAGANIGLTSVYFANRYPSARIYSIEPESANFELMCRNVAPYPNITPIRAALWNETTKLNLVDPGLGEWGFQTRDCGDEVDQAEICHGVDALTVLQLMETYQIPKIDVLKIDIEGAEIEVLQSSSAWMKSVNTLMIELHERFRPGCEAALAEAAIGFDELQTRGPITIASRTGNRTKAAA